VYFLVFTGFREIEGVKGYLQNYCKSQNIYIINI
jgi:hypothetical protein